MHAPAHCGFFVTPLDLGLATATNVSGFLAAMWHRISCARSFSVNLSRLRAALSLLSALAFLDTRSVESTDHDDGVNNTTIAIVGTTTRSPRPLRAALAMRTRLAIVMASVVTMSQFLRFMRRPSIATPNVPLHSALHAHIEELLGPSASPDTTSHCRLHNKLTRRKKRPTRHRRAGRLNDASIKGQVFVLASSMVAARR